MAKFVPQAELPVSEQAQIRRDKLAALQAEGRDPFVITKFVAQEVCIQSCNDDSDAFVCKSLNDINQCVVKELCLVNADHFHIACNFKHAGR